MVMLRDYFSIDLDTFFNLSEFGEKHVLGKKEVIMIIEENDNQEKQGLIRDFSDVAQNIYESVKIIYLKASDYKKPEVQKKIKLDDEDYYVIHSSVSEGVLKIVLSTNESYWG